MDSHCTSCARGNPSEIVDYLVWPKINEVHGPCADCRLSDIDTWRSRTSSDGGLQRNSDRPWPDPACSSSSAPLCSAHHHLDSPLAGLQRMVTFFNSTWQSEETSAGGGSERRFEFARDGSGASQSLQNTTLPIMTRGKFRSRPDE